MKGTISISEKGQAVFPIEWRRTHGLTRGGEVRYAEVGDALVCTPVKPMTDEEVQEFLNKAGKPTRPPSNVMKRIEREIKASREARRR